MNIEEAITQLESLYQTATGQKMSPTEVRHSMNSNLDPISLLEYRVGELIQTIQDPLVVQRLQPWNPPMSVWESEEKIMIRVDLPSVNKEDIDISLRGSHLIINGLRKNIAQDAGFMPRLIEAPFGYFTRTVVLPFEAVTSDINTAMREGVLEIVLLKHAQKSPAPNKKPGNSKNPQ